MAGSYIIKLEGFDIPAPRTPKLLSCSPNFGVPNSFLCSVKLLPGVVSVVVQGGCCLRTIRRLGGPAQFLTSNGLEGFAIAISATAYFFTMQGVHPAYCQGTVMGALHC